jgi:hypothetical protein
MVRAVKKRAAARGHAGKPPITAIELIEKSSTAQSRTNESTKIEKMRVERERNPQLTQVDSVSSIANGGSTTMAGLAAAENDSAGSIAENIESRPEIVAAESI